MNISSDTARSIETAALTPVQVSTGQVISADGTTIGYRQFGHGPGLVILHGGGRASQHYRRLAEALADKYTVYIPDRRGRGLSGPAGDDYTLAKEYDDLGALLHKTGAHFAFGHSAGGLIALEAALRLPIKKLALYEPAVSIDGSLPLEWLTACEQAFAKNDAAAAFVIFFRGLRLNWMSQLPYWVLYPMVSLMLRDADGREMVELLPTLIREGREAQRLDSTCTRYQNISADILLLCGSKSPTYLRIVPPALAKTMPHAHWIELPGLDHNAPDQNAPEVVAAELKRFFA